MRPAHPAFRRNGRHAGGPVTLPDPAERRDRRPAEVFRLINLRSAGPGSPEIFAYIMRPPGEGPFPAVVALHGCGGLLRNNGSLSARYTDWGERLRAAGYVAVLPDSFGSRGHTSLCSARPRPVSFADRIGDTRGAADWLAGQPFIDTKRIALLGWSNGGSTLLRALAPELTPGKTDFIAAIAFYPGCRYVQEKTGWRPRLKPLILMGDADDWTPPAPCRALARRWGARLVFYEGAYHAFDAPNSKIRRLTGRAYTARGDGVVHVGTDPRARAEAITEVMNYLKQAFSAHPAK